MTDERARPAGDFASWLDQLHEALRGERDSEVPCDGCTACCTASQFVHVGPEEVDTLAHVPAALLFPAPGLPEGHLVMGYDERGHCPMLVEGGCSIYEHRPQACRTYDCRIFAATGIDADKVEVDRRVSRWRFSFPTQDDHERYEAVRAAARSWRARSDRPRDQTQLAVRAVRAVVSAEPSDTSVGGGPVSGRSSAAGASR